MTERRYTPEDYREAARWEEARAERHHILHDFEVEEFHRAHAAMLRQAAEDAEAAEPQMRLYCWKCDTKHDPRYDCPSNAERDR